MMKANNTKPLPRILGREAQGTPKAINGYSSKKLYLGDPEKNNPIVRIQVPSTKHLRDALKKARKLQQAYPSYITLVNLGKAVEILY